MAFGPTAASSIMSTMGIGIVTMGVSTWLRISEMDAIVQQSGQRLEEGVFSDTGDWVDRPGVWIEKVLPGVPMFAGFCFAGRVYRKAYLGHINELFVSRKIPRRFLWKPPFFISLATAAVTGPALVGSSLSATHYSVQLSLEEMAATVALSVPASVATLGALLFPVVFMCNLFSIALVRAFAKSGPRALHKFGSRVGR
eukprot:TRINITY_DN12117_c0_g1_i1.p1 TRINITY_DN12117_c0_g1~~TRINITY_DN12117_c0_g1_i1.p1  ORF type:complete len:198 (+),score=16.08 TRINITY_DN12117_c0_g1_i1:46-639(+)